MMGIYIKDMKMPDTGSYLVVIDSNTPGKTFITFKCAYDSRQIVGSYEAIPVPDHGRLVDIDALQHKFDYAPSADYTPRQISQLLEFEEIAPTVIPADLAVENGGTSDMDEDRLAEL